MSFYKVCSTCHVAILLWYLGLSNVNVNEHTREGANVQSLTTN